MFSHTPDEARSGGLVKACVPGKNYSVPGKIESLNETSYVLWIISTIMNIMRKEPITSYYEKSRQMIK